MRKLFGALVWILTLSAPALIVQYYHRFIDPMTPSEIKIATFAGTLAMLILAVLTAGSNKKVPSVSENTSVKTPKKMKTPKTPKTQKTKIVRDPATKSERLFKWNEDEGVWESEDGTSILDESKTEEWERQRLSDKSWQDKQREKLQNRDTAFDRDMDEWNKKQKKELADMEKEMEESRKFGEKHGKYDLNKEERKKFLEEENEKNSKIGKEAKEAGDYYDKWVNGLEWVQWGADFAMDVCDVLTLGAGRPIKNLYILSRNMSGDMMDCLINKKSIGKSALKSITKTTIDLTQANVSKIGYKYTANGLGDAVKGAIEAGEKGESVVGGFVKGGLKGTVRTGIDHGLSKTKIPWNSKSQDIAQKATKKSSEILGKQQAGQISEKVSNALRNKVRTEAASQIAAETQKTKDLLSTGLGRLTDGTINLF
ncbi:MAG: hypothetical protein IIZ47_05865 [Erysipelotrichaceae bacterium]|nr:hypothetical protein [Erysipelotrichaceae bacterium]